MAVKGEKVLVCLFVLGNALRIAQLPDGSILLVISLCALAALYLAGGFWVFSGGRQRPVFSILAGILLPVSVTGILFKLMYWEGAGLLLLAGSVICMGLLAAVLLRQRHSLPELLPYWRGMRIRTGILLALCAVLFFTPTRTLVRIQYYSNPEFAAIAGDYYSDHDNPVYRKRYEEYKEAHPATRKR